MVKLECTSRDWRIIWKHDSILNSAVRRATARTTTALVKEVDLELHRQPLCGNGSGDAASYDRHSLPSRHVIVAFSR